MRPFRLILSIFSLFLVASFSSDAQFFTSGDNPSSVKWWKINTTNYSVIYPEGLDSLARVYACQLEKWRQQTGLSIGFTPNERYRRPMPVVLEAFRADANGLVSWAPRRMELYTSAAAYSAEPLDWVRELAIHEGRHVAQMQLGRSGPFWIWSGIIGEMSTGAAAALYGGPAFLEGDAVVAETALTSVGRGRDGDFLEYMNISFDRGDYRDYYRWRYGSIGRYTPDYYRVGYITIGGMRALYDNPDFTSDFYSRITRHRVLFPFFNLQKTVKATSGKPFRKAWREVAEHFGSEWQNNARDRAPFMHTQALTSSERCYVEYKHNVAVGEDVYSVKSGLYHASELVRTDKNGITEHLGAFSSATSPLQFDPSSGKLWWSESVPDRRWGMKMSSRLRYMDISDGGKHDFTVSGRFYNPVPDGVGRIAAVEYPLKGGSAVVVMDGTGKEVAHYAAPDSLQIVECAWLGGQLYVSAISETGFGIYAAERGFAAVLEPQGVKIKQLRSRDGKLYFVSDLNGVNELYSLSPVDGALLRCSNNRYGASDFVVTTDGRMVFSMPGAEIRSLHVATDDEMSEKVDWSLRYENPIARKLSEQEIDLSYDVPEQDEPIASSPERYRKLPHILRVHSWAPIYFDYDSVMELSLDEAYSAVGIGATALMQNTLGTSSGSLSYGLMSDDDSKLRHSFHGKWTYSGLYPIFEASFDLNERSQYQYFRQQYSTGNQVLYVRKQDAPSLHAKLKVYVPLNFSSGGWQRGVIPQLSVDWSSDRVNTAIAKVKMVPVMVSGKSFKQLTGYVSGSQEFMGKTVGSVRAYAMRSLAPSSTYPRWGIGIDAGIAFRPGLSKVFTPSAYAYMYGYTPGIYDTHGVKYTAVIQRQFSDTQPIQEGYINTIPRGFSGSSAMQYVMSYCPSQAKFSVDYAFGGLPLDCSWLGPIAYIKSLEFTLHGDWSICGSSGNLYSAGADLAFRLGNLLWLPFDSRIGITWSYNGGSLWDSVCSYSGTSLSRNYFGAIFSVDL